MFLQGLNTLDSLAREPIDDHEDNIYCVTCRLTAFLFSDKAILDGLPQRLFGDQRAQPLSLTIDRLGYEVHREALENRGISYPQQGSPGAPYIGPLSVDIEAHVLQDVFSRLRDRLKADLEKNNQADAQKDTAPTRQPAPPVVKFRLKPGGAP